MLYSINKIVNFYINSCSDLFTERQVVYLFFLPCSRVFLNYQQVLAALASSSFQAVPTPPPPPSHPTPKLSPGKIDDTCLEEIREKTQFWGKIREPQATKASLVKETELPRLLLSKKIIKCMLKRTVPNVVSQAYAAYSKFTSNS